MIQSIQQSILTTAQWFNLLGKIYGERKKINRNAYNVLCLKLLFLIACIDYNHLPNRCKTLHTFAVDMKTKAKFNAQ